MSVERKRDLHLEIAHALFMDVVGFSKLLINDQSEIIEQRNQLVRDTPHFREAEAAGKLIRLSTGDGWRWYFPTARKRQWNALWKSAKRCRAIRRSNCGWECIVGQSTRLAMPTTCKGRGRVAKLTRRFMRCPHTREPAASLIAGRQSSS